MRKRNGYYFAVKRMFDVFCSIVGIVISLPFWVIAVIGIKLSDPGPVFYMANRVGKDNKMFRMFKFRSMRQGKANEAVFRGDEDRIFPFGKFMRASKIDELPQLINILEGTMSFVGPRPAAVDQINVTRGGKYAKTGRVPAGLTGPSALYDYIYGDGVKDAKEYETSVLPIRLALDLVYLDRAGILFDLRMIWWTILCVLGEVMHKKPEMILKKLIGWATECGIKQIDKN